MTNPFENETGIFHVLINEEGQYSLWPNFVAIPNGWRVAFESQSRATCIDFINEHWIDMRPKTLVEFMENPSAPDR